MLRRAIQLHLKQNKTANLSNTTPTTRDGLFSMMLGCSSSSSRSAAALLMRTTTTESSSTSAASSGNHQSFQEKWEDLINRHPKIDLNPCNSDLHPAVTLGALRVDKTKPKRSLQEAYDPFASCFVCSKQGELNLETRRTKDRKILQSKLERGVPERFEELPGIIAPGMIASIMACSGSWHGSIALMDRAVLARPPLMMLEKIVDFTAVDVLAPNEKCSVQTEIVSLDEPNFATVKMEMTIGDNTYNNSNSTSKETVCARAVMRFKKIGAVRSIS